MQMELRPADSHDADLLFGWVNDPEVRRNSFQSEPVEYQNHLRWFAARLRDPACDIFILCRKEPEKAEVGQIRFDRNAAGDYEIDYSIDPQERGKGFGSEIVRIGVETMALKLRKRIKFIGRVKAANVASARVFLKNGFRLEAQDAASHLYTRTVDV